MDPLVTVRATTILLVAGGAALSVAGAWAVQRYFARHELSTAAGGALGYFAGLVAGALGAAQSLTLVVPGTPFDPFALSVQWMAMLGGMGLSLVMGFFVPSMFMRLPISARAQIAIAATLGCLIAFRASPWFAMGLCANGMDWELVGRRQ